MKQLLSLAVLGVLLSTSVHASNMAISPVVLRNDASQTVSVVQLHNQGSEATTYQISVLAWSQEGASELVTPTREVLAYPPIVEVAPGAKRTVRLAKLASGTGHYRVLLREVPKTTSVSGIQRLTNYDLPLTFELKKAPAAITAAREGSKLTLSNSGTGPIQITAIGGAGATPWREGMLGWLLPGGRLSFDYQAPGSIVVKANGKPLTLSVL